MVYRQTWIWITHIIESIEKIIISKRIWFCNVRNISISHKFSTLRFIRTNLKDEKMIKIPISTQIFRVNWNVVDNHETSSDPNKRKWEINIVLVQLATHQQNNYYTISILSFVVLLPLHSLHQSSFWIIQQSRLLRF